MNNGAQAEPGLLCLQSRMWRHLLTSGTKGSSGSSRTVDRTLSIPKHDIIEEAKPEEREMIEREIANAGGEWGDAVLAGIKSLSFVPPKDIPREEHDRMKAAYLESVAENAPPDILVVKMADRLCNTLDFAKGNKGKARAYLAKGKCLFRRLDQMSHSEAIRKTLAEVESAIAD